MQDMEAVYGDKATYLSIGDTIMLGYKQKVFQAEIEEAENTQALRQNIAMNEALAEDAERQQIRKDTEAKLKMGRYRNEPLYEFNSVLYCDGIIDNVAQFLPKTTDVGT